MAVVQGKEIICPMRLLTNQSSKDATVLPFVTSDSHSITPNSSTDSTKDGPVVTVGDTEETFSKTMYLEAGTNETQEFIDGAREGVTIELWEINLADPVKENDEPTGKYNGTYYQGKITSISIEAPSDGKVEVSMEYAVEGKGQKGPCTVTDEDIDKLYEFVDTVINAGNASGGNDGGEGA